MICLTLVWTCFEDPRFILAGCFLLGLLATGIILLLMEFCDE